MTEKKRETEKKMSSLSTELFDYALKNGGLDMPMVALHEVFTALAARVIYDIFTDLPEDSDLTMEELLELHKDIFEHHIKSFEQSDVIVIKSKVVN